MKHFCIIIPLFTSVILLSTKSTSAATFDPDLFNINFNLFGVVDWFTDIISGKKQSLWFVSNTVSHQKLSQLQLARPEYDFIVVGSGSAGSVVANRLSENADISVLLIEAGGPENIITDTPGFYSSLAGSDKDWDFLTEPQTNSFLNSEHNRVKWQRGKSMGGSTAVNGMVYARGCPRDFDNWANNYGATGWSYNEVLPYFLRSEGNTDPEMLANGYHNSKGPLTITSNTKHSENPVSRNVVDACMELGFPQIDLNGPRSVGTNFVQQTIQNGSRMSVSKAFIEPVIDKRPNLNVLTNSYVTKVLFNSRKEAIGVEYSRFNKTYTVNATTEVILSAGALKTPQILLLSGVGPREQLTKFKIPVVADLAGVGANLHDHVFAIGLTLSVPSTGPALDTADSYFRYFSSRTGPLGHFDLTMCMGNSSINKDVDWPDVQVIVFPFGIPLDPSGGLAYRLTGMKREVFDKMYLPYINEPSFTIFTAASRPKSKGKLELRSSDPFAAPKMQPNYLSHADDVTVLTESLKWSYRLAQTNTFKKFGAKPLPTLVVGCEHLYKVVNDTKYGSMWMPVDDYLECSARHMTSVGWHMVGTAKMGNQTDARAVVDPQLRVLGGVRRLRVVDASIMPEITDANTNAPTIMIGERGAQFIKDEYDI